MNSLDVPGSKADWYANEVRSANVNKAKNENTEIT